MKVLDRSVKSIVRYVYGLKRYDSKETYLERLLGCSLDSFLKFRSMCFLYKLDCSTQPSYLRDLLFCGQLVIPRFELGVGKKTLI